MCIISHWSLKGGGHGSPQNLKFELHTGSYPAFAGDF